MAVNKNKGIRVVASSLTVLILLFAIGLTVHAHDVDGNGQEGVAEAIHALQVSVGELPNEQGPSYLWGCRPIHLDGGWEWSWVACLEDCLLIPGMDGQLPYDTCMPACDAMQLAADQAVLLCDGIPPPD